MSKSEEWHLINVPCNLDPSRVVHAKAFRASKSIKAPGNEAWVSWASISVPSSVVFSIPQSPFCFDNNVDRAFEENKNDAQESFGSFIY